MARRRFYIISLWIATFSLLLSTVLYHHHHMNRICFVEERCQEDGHVNDEHTDHQEKESAGCSVHQMHNFLINAKLANSIQKHILGGGHALVAVLPSFESYFPIFSLAVSRWQEHSIPLTDEDVVSGKRRGPPCIS